MNQVATTTMEAVVRAAHWSARRGTARPGQRAPADFIPPAILRIAARRAARAGDLANWPREEAVHDIELAARLLARLREVPEATVALAGAGEEAARRAEEQVAQVWETVAAKLMNDLESDAKCC